MPQAERQTPILFVLDEFATLGKFDLIPRAMARMRGLGCRFIVYVQNLSQLRAIYGEAGANDILGSAGVVQYFGGTNDMYTAKVISDLSGVSSVILPGSSINDQGTSTSYSVVSRPVYMPDEVMRLPLPNQLIKITGRQIMQEHIFKPSLVEVPQFQAFREEMARSGDLAAAVRRARTPPPQLQPNPQPAAPSPKGGLMSWLKRAVKF